MRCAALGCQKDASPTFCPGHHRKLPRDLRAAGKERDAVAYLGQKDGYLTPARETRPVVNHIRGGGTEYV